MDRLGMEEGVPIEHGMVTKAIERAQKQVEAQNFAVRKHLLEYDDVMNKQRENVYALRRELLAGKITIDDDEEIDTHEYVLTLAEGAVDEAVQTHCGRDVDPDDWDLTALRKNVEELFGLDPGGSRRARLRRQEPRRDARRAVVDGARSLRGEDVGTRRERAATRGAGSHAPGGRFCSGRITCTDSTTSRRESASADTASETPSSSTSARASRCSRR